MRRHDVRSLTAELQKIKPSGVDGIIMNQHLLSRNSHTRESQTHDESQTKAFRHCFSIALLFCESAYAATLVLRVCICRSLDIPRYSAQKQCATHLHYNYIENLCSAAYKRISSALQCHNWYRLAKRYSPVAPTLVNLTVCLK
jgi:hypothetical protein